MKNILTILLTLITLLLISNCDNCKNSVQSKYEFYFNAMVGDEAWSGKCYLDFGNETSQGLFCISDQTDAYLRIEVNFSGIGHYQLPDSSAQLFEMVGGDVLLGEYYSTGEPDDILNIHYYDDYLGIIKGTFILKIKKEEEIIHVQSDEFIANFINYN